MQYYQKNMKHYRQLILKIVVIVAFLFSSISSIAARNVIETRENSDVSNVLATATPESSKNLDQDDICAFSDDDCSNPERLHGNFTIANEKTMRNAEIITILFWMEDCASCAEVLNTVLPDITLKYKNQVVFFPIELKEIDSVDRFYQMAERLGVPKNNIGVPLLIIGDQVLIGDQIRTDLEKWIDYNLQTNQYAILPIHEFADQLPESIRESQSNSKNTQVVLQTYTKNQNIPSLLLFLLFGFFSFVTIFIIGFFIFKNRKIK